MTPELLIWLKDLVATQNPKEVAKFYKTKEWRTLRKVRRRIDNNECQNCRRLGKYSQADAVHHLQEVRVNPSLALNLTNLECICKTCHNKEHPEKLSSFRATRYSSPERW